MTVSGIPLCCGCISPCAALYSVILTSQPFPLNKNYILCICRAKGFQHQRMTNGAMNVEIGNPAYKIYEGEQDDDVGELLDADFTLDPDKVRLEQSTYTLNDIHHYFIIPRRTQG